MKKISYIVFLLTLFLPISARADKEMPSWIIDAKTYAEAIKEEIQKELAVLEEYKILISQGADLAKQAQQTVGNVVDQVDVAKDMATDALGSLNITSVVSKVAPAVANALKGKDTEKVAGAIQDSYSRKTDEGIEAAQVKQEATNTELIDTSATLFAKAMVLRQKLNDEEIPDPDLETEIGSLSASVSTMVQSMRRWNEILKMQAYVNNYDSFLENQNYAVSEGDDE